MHISLFSRFFKKRLRKALDWDPEAYYDRLAGGAKVSLEDVTRANLLRLASTDDPEVRARSIESLASLNRPVAASLAVRELAQYTKRELADTPPALYHLMLDIVGDFILRGVRDDVQSFLTFMSFGIDPNTAKITRYMPVRIYLSDDDPALVDSVSRRIGDYSAALGLEIIGDSPTGSGSWYKQFFAKTRKLLSRNEVIERLEIAQRAIELVALHKEQSLVDRNQAEAAARLIESLATVPNATCQIGSILVAKISDASGSRVFTRSLSPEQMVFLEKHQEVLREPNFVFDGFLEDQGGFLG